MVVFPNAKINVGLNIVSKRKDGFHDIETVFYPLQLSDALEMVPSDEFLFSQSGILVDGPIEKNLIVKAFRLMQQQFNIPNVKIHLHKVIPFGAGLGGGSADAAYTISGLNTLFKLGLDHKQMAALAITLGSDCPFFIYNKPLFAEGKGDVFSDCSIDLSGYHLVLVKPNVHVPTAIAYSNVNPVVPVTKLNDLVDYSIDQWKGEVVNDFEKSVFQEYPLVAAIKDGLYEAGAIYASMSGSGSSVFALFEKEPVGINERFADYFVWTEVLQ